MVLESLINLFPEQEEPKPNKFTIYMGEAIKKAREDEGLSQEKLAELIYRRRATLSDIENGKADVDAGTLWLLSSYLKKPLSYFYPDYARENIRPEEFGPLEHELLMHFIRIRGENLQKLAIDVIRTFEQYNPEALVDELTPFYNAKKEERLKVQALRQKQQKKK